MLYHDLKKGIYTFFKILLLIKGILIHNIYIIHIIYIHIYTKLKDILKVCKKWIKPRNTLL